MPKCTTCLEEKPDSKFNAECFTPDVCFRCRVSGVAFTNPIKSGQGDDQWRHSTIAEHNREIVTEGRKNGLDPVPVGNVSTGTTAGGMKRLQDAHKNLSNGKT